LCPDRYPAGKRGRRAAGRDEDGDQCPAYARHDDDDLSIALFDRAADAIVILDSTPLLDPSLAVELGSWLDLYGVGLVP
jgi:hypothetical protein